MLYVLYIIIILFDKFTDKNGSKLNSYFKT